jgi:uncharacterized protein (DUF1919 family)
MNVIAPAEQSNGNLAKHVEWSRWIKSQRNRVGAQLNLMGLERTDFTIISNDCWGQALYDEWGLPRRTPMVGAGMRAECFIQFLTDIQGYLESPLRFVSLSRHESINRLRLRRAVWPIGLLRDDVEVHFLHYQSTQGARDAWESGRKLVNFDRLAVKFSVDKDGAVLRHIHEFDRMPFKRKLLISERDHPDIPSAIHVPNYIINGAMMFRRSLGFFDCAHWLNTGEIKRTGARLMLNKLLYARGA